MWLECAVANRGTDTQVRSVNARCNQGGLELLEAHGFNARAVPLAEEALALLRRPLCCRRCPMPLRHKLLGPTRRPRCRRCCFV